jgi:hypothetical protein
VEFLLLRRALTRRIGPTGIARSLLVRLWGASLLSGAVGYGTMLLISSRHQLIRGAAAIIAFGIVYGATTLALAVPEARALVARARR